ncbi:AfsR/SARP family transcriptional regulator [Streptomyces sp. SM14]|uniref:AfsR/SARP family transcriptional regulator n=1 Tax=Streptomyces sp. SM14 TaxID=1736045 RepID=UPI000CD5A434|nr:AfsR/SARP family transcriptional regulator [Streptomyces sp. SM14]
MKIRLLGPLEVLSEDGEPSTVSAPMLRALLAALALRPGQVVPAGELAGQLWGTDLPPSARTTLRNYVMRLRKALPEGRIRTAAGGYQLVLDEQDTDLGAFRELLTRSRALTSSAPAEALEILERGLGLWRGTPLEDTGDCPLRTSEQARLEELRLTAVEERFDLKTALGLHSEIIDELTSAVHHHYLRERLARQLMLALHRCGRTADALVVYRTVRERLIDELGLEPGLELRQLEESILRDDPELRRPAAPAAFPTGTGPVRGPVMPNFPAAIATFVARDAELALVRKRLADAATAPGICLIDGAGGVGKSALAVRAARGAAEFFPDGLLYVDLRGADPHNPALAPESALRLLTSALSVPLKDIPQDVGRATELYRERLRGRRVLLLLDNALDAEQVRPLLPAEPGSAALVTSRTMLAGLADGHHVHLGRLADDDAVQMLRSTVGGAGASGRPEEWYELARVCGQLPLALRIVATRMAARPRWSLSDWIAVLREEHGRMEQLRVADLDLRASLMVSIDQLADSENEVDLRAAWLFPRLGVASLRSYTAATAAAAAGCTPTEAEEALERLTDARIIDSPRPGEYTLHDLLRSAAAWQADRLDPEEARASLAGLASWYLGALNSAILTFQVNEVYHDRCRAAADRFPATAHHNGYEQALNWLDSVREDVLLLAEQLSAPGYDEGTHLAGRPLSTFAREAALAIEPYFGIRLDWRDQERVCDIVLRVAERLDDTYGEAVALSQLGRAAGQQQDSARGTRLLRRADRLLGALGENDYRLTVLSNLAACLAMGGETEAARAAGEEAREQASRQGLVDTEVSVTCNLAYSYLKSGDARRGHELAVRAHRLSRLPYSRTMVSGIFAEYHLGRREYDQAARWAERAMLHAAGHVLDPYTTAHMRGLLATALRYSGREAAADSHNDQARAEVDALNRRENKSIRLYYVDGPVPGARAHGEGDPPPVEPGPLTVVPLESMGELSSLFPEPSGSSPSDEERSGRGDTGRPRRGAVGE